MRTAEGMLRGDARGYDDDEYAAVLEVRTHFARVPGFEDSYSWLAG